MSRVRLGPRAAIGRFARDDDGAAMVEFALVVALFLAVVFGLLDFGRAAFQWSLAEKAMQSAARIAVVRPAACPGVPTRNARGAADPPPRFGTSCAAGAGVCAPVAAVSCAGDIGNATVAEIWGRVDALLPPDATPANLRFTYSFDAALGFLGGPYVPMVAVELQNLTFNFATPVGPLLNMAGGAGGGVGAPITIPPMRTMLPGEDLATGGG